MFNSLPFNLKKMPDLKFKSELKSILINNIQYIVDEFYDADLISLLLRVLHDLSVLFTEAE